MSARFKDMNDCMQQMTAKYPNPAIRKQICQRLMGEAAVSSGGSNTAAGSGKGAAAK